MLRSRKIQNPGDEPANGTNRAFRSEQLRGDTASNDANGTDDANGKNKAFFPLWLLGFIAGSVGVVLLVRFASRADSGAPAQVGSNPIEVRLAQVTNLFHLTTIAPSEVDKNVAGTREDKTASKYHLVFSTDCSEFQNWQSYLLFHSALHVRQPGRVTRIASGCNNEDQARIQAWHDTHITDTMSHHFRVHFTPHFSSVVKDDGKKAGEYKFFNKPFGLRHWMEHGVAMGLNYSGTAVFGNDNILHPDSLVILTDPDMVLLRPITEDFSNDRDVITGPRRKTLKRYERVERGRPFAQTYALGTVWRTFDLDKIAGEDSPAKLVDEKDGWMYYTIGPPYIAHAADMYQIALKWTEFVPKVFAEHPHLLAEMYAFCIAAAHLNLPHQVIDSFMVSNTIAGGEGWPMVDAIPDEEVCEFAMHLNHSQHAIPSVVHYCQRYSIGPYFFGKRKLPKDFFTCDSPLLVVPPTDSSVKYDYQDRSGNGNQKKKISLKSAKRETFMICALTDALNDAALFFKKHHCSPGNQDKSLWL